MPMPMKSCMVPKANANAPANTPSACADRPNSARRPVAMMAVMVRNAWLSAKPVTSASSMAQAARRGSSGVVGVGGGGTCTVVGLQKGVATGCPVPSVHGQGGDRCLA
ncbi:hypothetical protein D3C71_1409540 [compost metagenome]